MPKNPNCKICDGKGIWNGRRFHCPICYPLADEIDEIKGTLEMVHTIPNFQEGGFGSNMTEEQESAYTHLINNAIEWLTWLVNDYDYMYDERNSKDFEP